MDNNHAIELAIAKDCTGCAACAVVCPTKAIQMTPDIHGFSVPEIDCARCVGCQACKEVCPVCNPLQREPRSPCCYAAQAEDEIRLVSTSGGIFTLLAESVLASGGTVFGVEIDEKMHVHHISVDSTNQLARLRGSKYVQSDPGNTYLEAKNLLEEGKTVLYSGCPCQIAALYKVLGKVYDNLYTVDLLCLGVPSPAYFQSSIQRFPADTIQNFSFRDKRHGQGWHCDSMFICTKDGGEYHYNVNNNSFEACFHNKIFLRESCYHCKYNNLQRVGDITLGDFWQIEEYDPSLTDNKGTSMVLVNNSKGQALFDSVKEKLILVEAVPPEVSRVNRMLGKPIECTPARQRFLDLYQRYGYEKAAEYAGFGKYDVGIVGCWSVENHGSNMTYYALYQTIRDMGLEPLMIERPGDAPWKPNTQPTGFAQSPYHAWELAPIFANRQEMRILNNRCDTFLLGSDQLFYHDLYASLGEFADLGYIQSYKRKIAYAASVGRSAFAGTQEQQAKLSYFLRRFQAVSVREKDAVPLFRDTFGVEAEFVLDPVFLCQEKYYREMAKRGKPVSDEPYIAVYMLDPSPEKENILKQVSQELGIPCRVFSDVARSLNQKQENSAVSYDVTATNEDWLRALMESEYIITDSFHGTCFAVIFQKQFLSIVNPYRGRSRFDSLMQTLNLEGRMIEELDSDEVLIRCKEPVNYQKIIPILQEEKDRSVQWLKAALQCQCDSAASGYDLLSEEIGPIKETAIEARVRSLSNEQWLSNTHERAERLEPQVAQLQQRIDAVEPWLSNTHERAERLEPQVAQLQQRIDAVEPWLANTHERAERLEPQVAQLQQRIDAVEPCLSNTHERTEQMASCIAELQKSLETVEIQAKCLQMQLSQAVEKINVLEKQTMWSIIKNTVRQMFHKQNS